MLSPIGIRNHRAIALWASLVAAAAHASIAEAVTIRVARDGSGDFSIIAEAVDAAASGDTISIAPGDYPETPPYQAQGGILNVVAWVTQSELTVIGDSRDAVIIGSPTEALDRESGPGGFVCPPGGNISLSGVTVRNSSHGIDANEAWVTAVDCKFLDGWRGVTAAVSGMVTISDCVFEGSEDAGLMVFSVSGGTGAIVERCTFVDNGLGIDVQPQNCTIRTSAFEDNDVGLQVSFGGSGLIERCTFKGPGSYGIAGPGGAQLTVLDNVFREDIGVNIRAEGYLYGAGNHLGGGSYATLWFNRLSTVDFHGNHILNAGGWSVRASYGPEPIKYFDLSHNYWGTTDPDLIDEWIYDHNDRENYQSIVEYLPLAGMPIPTGEASIGRLKARFSDQ